MSIEDNVSDLEGGEIVGGTGMSGQFMTSGGRPVEVPLTMDGEVIGTAVIDADGQGMTAKLNVGGSFFRPEVGDFTIFQQGDDIEEIELNSTIDVPQLPETPNVVEAFDQPFNYDEIPLPPKEERGGGESTLNPRDND